MSTAQVLTDGYGLPITTTSEEALNWYNQGIHGILGFRQDTPDCFEKALAIDPNFHMARGHLGVHYFMEETAEALGKARDYLTQACEDLSGLTDRERDVLETLQAWAQGKGRDAVQRMHAALETRPREAVLLQKLYFIYFMQGASEQLRDIITPIISHYENDSYVQGMYSFALEENREFAKALEIGMRARELNSQDVWTLHALAHIYYETGAFAAGSKLLDEGIPQCEGVGFFRNHVVWHLALFEWEQGHYQKALSLYREQSADPAELLIPPNLVDAVSLLWRLDLTGQKMTEEWKAVEPSLDRLRKVPTYMFNQMHCALGLTGAGRLDWATEYLDALRARVKPERPGLVGEVGVPLVEGLIAYAKGEYANCVDCLLPIKDKVIKIGGSHAQREVFADILLDACLQAKAYDEAIALLETKRRHRPERPLALLGLERAYAGKGEVDQAGTAGENARQLWQKMGADEEVLQGLGS